MYSNYNVLTIPISADGKYKVGDKFLCDGTMSESRIRKFHGLEIKSIDYAFGVRLHFDWNEWKNNIPFRIKREARRSVIEF